MAPNISFKFFITFITFILFTFFTPPTTTTPTIGVTYSNRLSTTSPSPEQLASALNRLKITSVRLLGPEPNLIRAFSYSPTSLILSIPNSLIPALAADQSSADEWLHANVLPFYPRANISVISVGSNPTPNVADFILPAIQNLQLALRQLGIRKISVSTTFSFISVVSTAFPPSSATFKEPIFSDIIRPLLDFLEEANSPFLINLFPYLLYHNTSTPIGFALFQDSPYMYRDDPVTGARYRNLFDEMVDAVLVAMAVAGHESIPVIVTETGWPSSGATEESEANPMLAEMYLKGLMKHLKSGSGTPLKKESASEVYLYELFDKEMNNSSSDQKNIRQWGILYPNFTRKYKIDFSGLSENLHRTHHKFVLLMVLSTYYLVVGMII